MKKIFARQAMNGAIVLGSLAGCFATEALAAPTPKTWIEPVTGIVFVAMPKGCYRMGSDGALPPSGSLEWLRMGFAGNLLADEQPRHEVCLDAFWIARHEVRQRDWHAVMGGDVAGTDGNRPAGNIAWRDALAFAERLNALTPGPVRFRLPSEAEWEYACRAGRQQADEPPLNLVFEQAWFSGGYRTMMQAEAVATLLPNAWGLHDLVGNVWEWVGDVYQADGYRRHSLYNPRVETGGGDRVIRGGSFRSEANQIRCGNRGHYPENESLPQIGFRLVMTGVGVPAGKTKR